MVWSRDIPIYDARVLFLVESSYEEIKDTLKQQRRIVPQDWMDTILQDVENECCCDGATYYYGSDNSHYIVFIRKVTHRNVSHELFHLVNCILDSRGVTHDENAEPWAYLIGWITEMFYSDYSEIKKELRKAKKEYK